MSLRSRAQKILVSQFQNLVRRQRIGERGKSNGKQPNAWHDMEALEPRVLLSVDLPFEVLTDFDSKITPSEDSQSVSVNLSLDNLAVKDGSAIISLHATTAGGRGLDPASTVVRNAAGGIVSPILAVDDLERTTDSLVLIELQRGIYTFEVVPQGDSKGDFHLDVGLFGYHKTSRTPTDSKAVSVSKIGRMVGPATASASSDSQALVSVSSGSLLAAPLLPGGTGGGMMSLLSGGGGSLVDIPFDYNHDESIDAGDLDLLSAAIRDGATDAKYDLDSSGTVDTADRAHLVESELGTFVGDIDLDSWVSIGDLAILSAHFDETGVGWAEGDLSGDWKVSIGDLSILSSNFGQKVLEPAWAVATLGNDTAPQGKTNSDEITSDPLITGLASAPGNVTEVLAGFGATPTYVDITADLQADNRFTLDMDRLEEINGGTPLTNGAYAIHFQVTDDVANVRSRSLDFTLDTVGPLSVSFGLTSVDQDGSDDLANKATVQLDGSTEAGATAQLELSNQVMTADGSGDFSFAGVALDAGLNEVTVNAYDAAGNSTSLTRQIAYDDGTMVFLDEDGHPNFFSYDRDTLIDTDLTIEGTPVGAARTLRIEVQADFDTSSTSADIEDLFQIYIVDDTNDADTLLDNGEPGTAVFSLAGDQAEYTPGLVRYDGSVVEIDLTRLNGGDGDQARVIYRLIDSDDDTGTRVFARILSNDFELTGVDNPALPTSNASLDPQDAAGLVISGMTLTTDVDVLVNNIRVEEDGGTPERYIAEVRVRNNGSTAIGRDVAAVFTGLPVGVTVQNPTGTEVGDPYISLRDAIDSGGLAPGKTSDAVLVLIDNTSDTPFSLATDVYIGGANQAPDLASIGALSVMPGGYLSVQLSATDTDGDLVTFSVTGDDPLPGVIITGNGELVITPAPGEDGVYTLIVTANDGALPDSEQVTLTVNVDPVTTTRISGKVLDTNEAALVGVPIELDTLSTTTAADGTFTLTIPGTPPSDTLFIDGAAITGDYPSIGEMLPLLLGHELYDNVDNVIGRPIYLPTIDVANGTTIDPMMDTMAEQEVAPGEMASVFVEAGSLQEQGGGMFDGDLSITEVQPDLTPAALPANMFPDLVVTIQPGGLDFMTPAPLTVPNRSGWPAGTLMDLLSIDPETGDFAVVGKGKVSNDGLTIETTEDGIVNSSWHFFAPPPEASEDPDENPDDEEDDCECDTKSRAPGASDVELHSGALIESHELSTYQSLGATRGVSLTYDSLRADPRPILHFGYRDLPGGLPLRAVARLSFERGGMTYQVPGADPVFGLPGGEHFWAVDTGVTDIKGALQADLTAFPSGRYNYDLSSGVMIRNASGLTGSMSSREGTVLHINSIDSIFGSGWGMDGLEQLIVNPDGSVVLINGNGNESLYELDGANYVSPVGDFSTLVRDPVDDSFTRTTPDMMVYTYAGAVTEEGALLSEVTDRYDNTTTYEYDTNGLLIMITDPAGLETTFDYSGPTGGGVRVTKITDPAGRDTLLEYDAGGDGNLVKITDPDESFRTFEYDTQHLMTVEIDKTGDREEVAFDFAGRVTRAMRADGTVVEFSPAQTAALLPPDATLDPDAAPPAFEYPDTVEATHTDANGSVVRTVLDKSGRAVASDDGAGEMAETVRNADSLIEERTTPRGWTTSYIYNDAGSPLEITESGPGISSAALSVTTSVTPGQVVTADLNNDSLADLIVTNNDFVPGVGSTATIFLGKGDGTFASLPAFTVTDSDPGGLSAVSLAIGQLNNDPYIDLVTANHLAKTYSVLLGNGDGTFAPKQEYTLSVFAAYGVALADFNGDGLLDLVTGDTDVNDPKAILLEGNGDGTFEPFAQAAVASLKNLASEGKLYPASFITANLNDDVDDYLDLVAIDDAGNMALLFGDGDGGFLMTSDPSPKPITQTISTGSVGLPFVTTLTDGLASDLNGDGHTDLVSVDWWGDHAAVHLGDGLFNSATYTATLYDVGAGPTAVDVDDIDGDGDLDLVVSSLTDGTATLLLGEEDGSFGAADNPSNPNRFDHDLALDPADGPTDLVFADVTSDGRPEVVTANTDNTLSVILNSVLLDGAGLGELTQTFTYDPIFNQLTSVTDELGHQTLYEIDTNNGNTTEERRVIGLDDRTTSGAEDDDLVTTFEYTSIASGDLFNGLIKKTTDPEGRETVYTYTTAVPDGADGWLKKITFASGTPDEATREFEYDLAGNQTAIIDENGHRTEYVYDELNRLITVIEADPDDDTASGGTNGPLESPTRSFTYDDQGNQITATDSLDRVTTNIYDAMNRVIKTADALDQETLFEYDEAGNLIKVTDPLLRITENEYDSRNRLIRTINPEGGITAYEYDADNNRIAVTDPNGNTTRFTYDARNRLIRETDAEGHATIFVYDDANNRTKVIDRNFRLTQFIYDEADRLIQTINPDQTTTSITYDKAGNVISQTDELGRTTTFVYDARDRLIQTNPADNVDNDADDVTGQTQIVVLDTGEIIDTLDAGLVDTPTIIDVTDAAPDFQILNGGWGSANAAPYGDYVYKEGSSQNLGKVRWTFGGLHKGTYRVATTWVPNANRAIDAPYAVLDGSGDYLASEIPVNQELTPADFTDQGIPWHILTEDFQITGDTLIVDLHNDVDVGSWVIGGSVWILRTGDITPPPGDEPTYMDVNDAGFAVVAGFWHSHTSMTVGPIRWADPGTGTRQVAWTFNGLTNGMYRVSTTWHTASGTFATDAPFTLFDDTGDPTPLTVDIDQQPLPNDFTDSGITWEDIAGGNASAPAFDVTNGTLVIQLTDDADGFVTAGPMRIQRVDPLPPEVPQEPLGIGGRVWGDVNGDGYQDAGEPGIAGVDVTLTGGGADGLISTTGDNTSVVIPSSNQYTDYDNNNVFDAAGFYWFPALVAGTEYRVTFSTLPPAANFTTHDLQIKYTYDLAGNLLTTTDLAGNVTTHEYDNLNRRLKTVSPDPDNDPITDNTPETSQTYNAVGNLITSTDPNGNTTQFIYDDLNRQVKVISPDPDGIDDPLLPPVTLFTYDAVGNQLTVKDPLGRVTTNEYDALNRLEKTIAPDPDNNPLTDNTPETEYTYDLNSNLKTLKDPEDNTTEYFYDTLNRLIKETDPLLKDTTYAYDKVGNRLTKTDREGRVTQYAYDTRNRLITETWMGTDGVTPIHTITSTYDAASNLAALSDNLSALAFTYDTLNRLTSVDNVGTQNVPNVVITYTYDANGNVLAVTDDQGGTTAYAYDDLNRLELLTQSGIYGSGSGATDKRVDLAYNKLGQYTSIERYSDTAGTSLVATSTYTYDDLNRLTLLAHTDPLAASINSFAFTYDVASQITQLIDADGTNDFGYDDNSRLIDAEHTDAALVNEDYVYDENGNRTESHLHGDNYATGGANQLNSDGVYDYDYDDEGNLTSRTHKTLLTVREFTYDHRNRLIKVDDRASAGGALTQSVTYTYDALNRRINKGVDDDADAAVDSVSYFVYDREDVILDFVDPDGDGVADAALDKRFLHGPGADMILAQEDVAGTTGVLWLLTDHLGTTRDIVDNSGAIKNHIKYDSFGQIIEQSDAAYATRYLYTGREWDAEIELYYYRARFYDPAIGRFIQQDPIGFRAGPNTYAYVENNPVERIDPTGLDFIAIADRGVTGTREILKHYSLQYWESCESFSPLNRRLGFSENQIRSKVGSSATKVVSFELIPSTKWFAWGSNGTGWEIESVWISEIHYSDSSSRIMPILDGDPKTIQKTWLAMIAVAQTYKFAEQQGFTANTLQNWPNSIYKGWQSNSNTFIRHVVKQAGLTMVEMTGHHPGSDMPSQNRENGKLVFFAHEKPWRWIDSFD